MKIKKIISIMMISVIMGVFAISAFASDIVSSDTNKRSKTIKEVARQIEKDLPAGSKVKVVDGEIVAFVNRKIGSNSEVSMLRSTTYYYSPEGGSFRSFTPQPFQTVQPYSMMFIDTSRTNAMIETISNSNIYNFIHDNQVLYPIAEALAEAVNDYYNIDQDTEFTAPGINFILEIPVWAWLGGYDEWAIRTAKSNSDDDKIVIQKLTNNGWPVTYYFAWEGNFCSASPYEAWTPTFHSGEYDLMD